MLRSAVRQRTDRELAELFLQPPCPIDHHGHRPDGGGLCCILVGRCIHEEAAVLAEPATSILLSFLSPSELGVLNARKRLSGDHASGIPPSVPSNGRTDSESSSRTQMETLLSLPTAAKATRRPSGETTSRRRRPSSESTGLHCMKRSSGTASARRPATNLVGQCRTLNTCMPVKG
jgi:hypothetical protein